VGAELELGSVRLLEPVSPSKILCIGKNYRKHAAEMGGSVPEEPLVFMKPPSSLLAPGETVLLPAVSERVDYEAELGVVIGRRGRNVSVDDALDHVFGYTALCDVTARDLQARDDQWTRAKGFDTFCPTGPVLVTSLDPTKLKIRLWQNDTLRQDGETADLVFSVRELIAYLSGIMTLEPGDLIATGTPDGVGPLHAGDAIRIEIDGVLPLQFRVQASP
jgi:2-keto-4-pentenoate hydratase/2-oxohepta-3-ene-1,7-dioic acid hydratase in catechol pathway